MLLVHPLARPPCHEVGACKSPAPVRPSPVPQPPRSAPRPSSKGEQKCEKRCPRGRGRWSVPHSSAQHLLGGAASTGGPVMVCTGWAPLRRGTVPAAQVFLGSESRSIVVWAGRGGRRRRGGPRHRGPGQQGRRRGGKHRPGVPSWRGRSGGAIAQARRALLWAVSEVTNWQLRGDGGECRFCRISWFCGAGARRRGRRGAAAVRAGRNGSGRVGRGRVGAGK